MVKTTQIGINPIDVYNVESSLSTLSSLYYVSFLQLMAPRDAHMHHELRVRGQ